MTSAIVSVVEPLLFIAVPFPNPAPLPVLDPDLFGTFFQQQQKNLHKNLPFQC
jgi:hypothetical protein